MNHQSFFYKNSLSLVFATLMILSLVGQALTGHNEHNEERKQNNAPEISLTKYLTSGHFMQATFENWESEFLQMAMYVWFTIFLRQKGSSESKSLDEPEEVDREPVPKPDAPWPVKKGGWWLKVYKNSLTFVFVLLFFISFVCHFYGSRHEYNELQILQHKPVATAMEYIANTKFWFESFQNWQSEFLSVLSIVVLSIFLRQKGSPESKPVDASNEETGK